MSTGKKDSAIELDYTNEEGVKDVEAKRPKKSSVKVAEINNSVDLSNFCGPVAICGASSPRHMML